MNGRAFDGPDVVDAYLRWLLATRLAPFPTKSRPETPDAVGLIVEWKTLDDAANGKKWLNDPQIVVPRVYSGPPRVRRVWTISAAFNAVPALLERIEPHVRRVELASPTFVDTDHFLELPHPVQSQGPVLAAVLDDGCAFANRRFRDAHGTRVIWLWQQDASRGRGGRPVDSVFGPTPAADFLYGRAWAKVDLDPLIFALGRGGEAAVCDAFAFPALRREALHGTHVMDLFAGGAAFEIAFVQFPAAGIADPAGLWLARYALDGLHYALECAGPNTQKIVVNISWGPQTGPHDGTSVLETAIDELVAEQASMGRKLIVCVPSGNTYAAQAHGSIDAAAGGTLKFRVPPDGETPAFLEIWWPKLMTPSDIRLTLTPPGGSPVVVEPATAPFGDGTWYACLQQPPGQGAMMLLVVNSTGGPRVSPHSRGRSGAWILSFGAGPAPEGKSIHLYVARADHNMGARRRATASRLDDEFLLAARFRSPSDRDAEAPGSAIARAGSLNGMATGKSTTVASGYTFASFGSARYSSAGPSRDGGKVPDCACATDRSRLQQGVPATGVRSGTRVIIVGTSTAAPQMARQMSEGAVALFEPVPPAPACHDAEPRVWPDDVTLTV